MTQEKMRKLITACVTAATVLFVVLLSFLIYQWIRLATLNKKIADAEAEVAYWGQQVSSNEDTLRDVESESYILWAYEHLKIIEGRK